MIRLLYSLPAVVLLSAAASAQQITVRDTIEALPPISFCMDGATHRTVCTNLRLRPAGFGNLVPFEGLPLEITGMPGQITCSYVDVGAVTVLTNAQFTSTTVSTVGLFADFFGDGPPGDVYLLFLSLARRNSPLMYPGITGPVHLELSVTFFFGVHQPQGVSTPYHTIAFPTSAIGLDFFDQALALHSNGQIESTVVDCFRF